MAKKNIKFKVNNKYFLCGALALVAFFLMDVIGGFNFPGYDWISKVIADLTALNSYALPIALTFSIICALLVIFAGFITLKFIKNLKFNKTLNFGLRTFIIAAIVLIVGTTIFLQPESGTYQTIKDNAVITTKDEPILDEEGNETGTQEVIDFDATKESFSNLKEPLLNPFMIGNLACNLCSGILAFVALIYVIIGGFKKKGNILFGAFAVFCIVMIVYAAASFLFGESSMIGINARFSSYSIMLFFALISSYVYVTNIEE